EADGSHAVPQGRVGFLEAREDDETGIVDQRIEPAEARDRKVDETDAGAGILEVLVTGGRGAARGRDLRYDAVGHRRIVPAAILGDARVMHDHRGAARGEQARIGGAEATSGPGDDRHLAIEANGRGHGYSGNSARAAATSRGSVNIG